MPRIERKLTLCTLSLLETSLRIVGPMKDLKSREKVTTRRSHSTTIAEAESCGLLIMRVLQKSAITAKESASDIIWAFDPLGDLIQYTRPSIE